jgi:hypothetical protein
MRSVAGSDGLTCDDEPGVGVHGEGYVVLAHEPHGDRRDVDRAERGAAVEMPDDPFRGPAVLRVSVRTPLTHAPAVTVAVAGERERGVGRDRLLDCGCTGPHVRDPADRGADQQGGCETEGGRTCDRGLPSRTERTSDDDAAPADSSSAAVRLS